LYVTRETTIFSYITDPVATTYQRLKSQPRNFVAIGILIILVYFGLTSGHLPLSPTANADAQRMVSLYADGQKRVFATEAKTVGDVLKRGNVTLQPGDLVEPAAGTPITQGVFNINIYRGRPVLVQDGYRFYHIKSAYQNPRLLAQAAGLQLYPEDRFQTGLITNVVGDEAIGVKVAVKRAAPMTVHADGQTKIIRTQAGTVADALKTAGVQLGLKDTVSTPADAPVVRGMEVAVTRVSDVETTVTTTLPAPVKTITDPTLLKGRTVVQIPGSDGQKVAVYRVHYRDGVETGRELVKLVSQTDPVTRVEVIGTKVFFGGSVEYWRPLVEQAAVTWGLDPNTMLRIMSCESGGNATTVSRFIVAGEHPTGLFQYLPSTWRAAGGTDDNILDGAAQIRLTAKKMATSGTGAWACR
jgi:uncharacterized protein YabE (DUF348 family)